MNTTASAMPPAHPNEAPGVTHTELLVIGAGPYGLATAAAARAAGIKPFVVGEPMGFWRRNMPAGMLLRSSVDWHLDPRGEHTLAAYLDETGRAADEVDPVPLDVFVDYGDWFRAAKRIAVHRERVRDVRRLDGHLEATLDDGRRLRADAIVAAPGVEPFTRVPSWVERDLPPERFSHTAHVTEPARLAGARVVIVGGRQSAFETAALLAEAGAEQVEVVHRHAPPAFTAADWGFVEPLMKATTRWPGWFRALAPAAREAVERRFWMEGRLKLEPWLAPRLDRPQIRSRAHAEVTGVKELGGGTLAVKLSGGETLHADHIVLATGYQADLARIPYLAGVLADIEQANGFPVLDERFQSSVPGLFLTGFAATQDFGPFFGFVRGTTVAATIIAAAIEAAAAGEGDRAPRRSPGPETIAAAPISAAAA